MKRTREDFQRLLAQSKKVRSNNTLSHYARTLAKLEDQLAHGTIWWYDAPGLITIMESKPFAPATKVMYYSAILALLEGEEGSTHWQMLHDKMMEHNASAKDATEKQDLDSQEIDNWPEAEDIASNKDLWPLGTPQRLFYEIIWGCRDTCAFRVDLVYNTIFTYKQDIPKAPGDKHWLILDKYNPKAPLEIQLNHYKTSYKYGPRKICLPDEDIKRALLEMPFMKEEENPNGERVFGITTQVAATRFVINAWILDHRQVNMNNLRSALMTRYARTHPRYLDMKKFAELSGTSYMCMVQNYTKVFGEEETRDKFGGASN